MCWLQLTLLLYHGRFWGNSAWQPSVSSSNSCHLFEHIPYISDLLPILIAYISFFCCVSVWIIENAANLVKTEALTKYSSARALHQPMGFSGSSAGKESTCNAGDPGLIPGSGRSAGEGMGYPLQYSWASLVAQLVKNSLAMWETWVWSLGWEDPLEKGKAPHSSILAWRIPWTV